MRRHLQLLLERSQYYDSTCNIPTPPFASPQTPLNILTQLIQKHRYIYVKYGLVKAQPLVSLRFETFLL